MGPKWRPPRKTQVNAWKRIEKGNLYWDRKAVVKKATRRKEHLEAFWENLKKKNPKAKRPFPRI